MEQRLLANRYRISRELARGGMGVVYEGVDSATTRRVAVKVILGDLAGQGDSLARFVREARACASLDHPGVVPVLDAGSDRGNAYLVMGFLEGETLQARIRRAQRLEVREAVQLASQLAGVLDYVHGRGILHRDVKPENVILTPRGPVLTDFGVAFDGKSEQERLTQSGMILGTPAFMPPEQVDGDRDRIDARADVYALGATLYACLAGRPPFSGHSVVNLLRAVLTEPPPKLSSLAPVEPSLEAIVQRCLQKDPAQRYASAAELRAALEDYLVLSVSERPEREVGRAGLWIGAGLVALGGVAAGVLLASRAEAPSPDLASASTTPAETQAATRTPAPSLAPTQPPSLEAARLELARRKWDPLRAELIAFARAHPRSSEVWTLLGELALRECLYVGGAERLAVAGSHLDRALELDPDRVEALALRVKVRSRLGQEWEADARRAIRLGEAKVAMGHVAEADRLKLERQVDLRLTNQNLSAEVRALREALALDPACWWAACELISRLTDLRQYDEAERAAREALRALPEDPYLEFRRGFNFKMQAERTRKVDTIKRSLEAYDRAFAQERNFRALYIERGYAHNLYSIYSGRDEEHYALAVRDLETAIARDPSAAHAHWVLGVIHSGHRRFREALGAYQGCVEVKPDHYRAWYAIAQAKYRLRDLPGAKVAAAKAVELCPLHDPDLPAIAEFKEKLGQMR